MLKDITQGDPVDLTSLDNNLIQYAKQEKYGELHFKFDNETGLIAIVAIHDTTLGPALGGCRLRRYPDLASAVKDAMRLAKGMTYKAAITGLPLGGGKSVILKPGIIFDRRKFFNTFGQFINDLGGRYITAMDSGTNTEDMDAIAEFTEYATSTSELQGDPSPSTATGVFHSIRAAVQYRLGKESLNGLHVAIQGVGHVGYYLAKHLHEVGARLTVTDVNQDAVDRCVSEFGAESVMPEAIYDIDCDIFSPCALGAILNDDTIKRLKCGIIVGSANNQLAELYHGQILFEKNILYAPDYVANAGGLIFACAQYYRTPLENVSTQVEHLYDACMDIFKRSDEENLPTSVIADIIAEERLLAGGKVS